MRAALSLARLLQQQLCDGLEFHHGSSSSSSNAASPSRSPRFSPHRPRAGIKLHRHRHRFWLQLRDSAQTRSDMMSSVYGVTMQWTSEQPQWAEQHYDITSTTRSPAHKFEAFRSPRLPGSSSSSASYQHSWANDDISALTASNLLKRYAERYSAILDLPCEGGLVGYPDPSGPSVMSGAPSLLNSRKLEAEPWLESAYPPLGCVSELVPKPPLSVSDMSASGCSSPGIGVGTSSLPEPAFSSSSCSSQTSAQDFGSVLYSAPYLQPVGAYNGPLLHPVASHPSLVQSYAVNTSPSLPTYGYPNAGYPSQSSLSQPYSPPSPSVPSLTTASVASAMPASSISGYSYPTSSLAPAAPSDASPSSSNLAKTYYSTGQNDMRGFEEFGYASGVSNSESRSPSSPKLYRPQMADEGHKGRGFETSSDETPLHFKTSGHSESLRSLESLTATMGEHRSAVDGQSFTSTSCSAASSHTYSPSSSHEHLCLDAHMSC